MPANIGKTAIELFIALVVLTHMSGIQKIINPKKIANNKSFYLS